MRPERTLSVRPIALQGELEETRYRKRDDGKYYAHEGSADLWLVETSGGQRGTLSLPRRGAGWTKDGGTYWLTNSPHEATHMSKRTSSARRTKKRPPPRGFKTWAAYMASIRPGGKKMAKARKRGRKSTRKKTATRRRSSVVVLANPHRRRRHRRNPPLMKGLIGRLTNGAIGGTAIVVTKATARAIRSRAFSMPAGTLKAGAVELTISTAAGIVAAMFISPSVGQSIIDGGFANAIEQGVTGLKVPFIASALGDGGRSYVIRNGRALPRRLNGYVAGPAGRPALGGYVAGPDRGAMLQHAAVNAGG